MKKLFAFIGGNRLIVAAIGIGVVLLIIALFLFFRNVERGEIREEENLRNQGAVEEQRKQQGEVINAVQNANRPVTDPERRAECLRNNRNPAACDGS